MPLKPYNGFKHNQRMKGLKWLRRQYAAGLRTPPTRCEICGQTQGAINGHSEDYSEPFGDHIGRWALCSICHDRLHKRFSAKGAAAFQQYGDQLAKGIRRAPDPSGGHCDEDTGTPLPGFAAVLTEGEQVLARMRACESVIAPE